MQLSRRHLLLGSLAGLAGCARAPAIQAMVDPAAPSLAQRAARHGLLYGAAVATDNLNDPDLSAALASECNLLVTEFQLQWERVEPVRGRPDYAPAERIAAFAAQHGMKLRGHAALWHKRVPAWFIAVESRTEARDLVEKRVAEAVGRFAGRMQSWDVVNEALLPRDGRPDGMRKTALLDKLGPEFLDLAFRTARAADPRALLVYNEFGFELADAESLTKRRHLPALLRGLLDRGVPVDALGIQAHLRTRMNFNPDEWARFLDQIAGMGLKLVVSEMDVTDAPSPGDIAARDAEVAATYAAFLAPTLAQKNLVGLLCWGLSDRYSWIVRGQEPYHKRADGLPPRPLPLDAALRRKPAWDAMARAFDAAPSRG